MMGFDPDGLNPSYAMLRVVVPVPGCLLNSLEALQQILALGDGARRIHLRIPDDALRIDEERRARIHAAFFIEDTVGFADRAVRPVVGEQRERQAAQLFDPDLQARYGVGADLQDFNVERLELCVVLTEPADLILSPAGKCERQK